MDDREQDGTVEVGKVGWEQDGTTEELDKVV
jgi:hypothetical protein